MRPGYCKAEYKYKVSKYLFLKFLGNPETFKGLGTLLITNILSWFKQYVEVHEQNFCYYLQSQLLHFGVYLNTQNEGMHNGMRSNAAQVTAMHSIHRTLTILTKKIVCKEQLRSFDLETDFLLSRTYVVNNKFDDLIVIDRGGGQTFFCT